MQKAFTTSLLLLLVNAWSLSAFASPSSPTADEVPFVASKILAGGASLVTAMRPGQNGSSILTYTKYDVDQNILARTTMTIKGDDVIDIQAVARAADGSLVPAANLESAPSEEVPQERTLVAQN